MFPSSGDCRCDGRAGSRPVPAHYYLSRITICQPGQSYYCPLSFGVVFDIAAFGDAVALVSVDGVVEVALDDELGLVDGDVLGVDDVLDDDGDVLVLGVDDDELDDDGVLGLIDELDDVDPLGVVDGVVVVDDDEDVEGDGVTTGGVVVVGVLVSR